MMLLVTAEIHAVTITVRVINYMYSEQLSIITVQLSALLAFNPH